MTDFILNGAPPQVAPTLDLGDQLPVVPGPDVGLEDQADARRGGGDDVDGLLHHRHHLVPLPLDVGEHRVGLVGETGVPDHADRGRHRLGHPA